MAVEISTLSILYVETAIASAADPTGDVVNLALPLHDVAPITGDWHVGTWKTDGLTHNACLLVGPGTVVYAAGLYDLWVKITDSPETPALKAGQVRFS